MTTANQRSREIIEILADVVRQTSVGCEIVVMGGKSGSRTIPCPDINYTFGNAQYVKERLDELSKTARGNEMKFPLIALFCPFNEQRNSRNTIQRQRSESLSPIHPNSNGVMSRGWRPLLRTCCDRYTADSSMLSKKMAGLISLTMNRSSMNTLKTTLMADMGRTRVPGNL